MDEIRSFFTFSDYNKNGLIRREYMKKKTFVWVAIAVVFGFMVVNSFSTPSIIADPETYQCGAYGTFLSLLPPIIAIVLALLTKEVYTSLFIGILTGAILYSNGNLVLTLNTVFFNEDGGMVTKLSDSWNVGILIFLVILGILVALMNKAGGSAAFGNFASSRIKKRKTAQLLTMILGVLIFVDDYFNCLTVGSVMRPVTDRYKISRAKLAYLIDATAAPVCIIAPVSSWAAAVTSSVPEGIEINGFTTFLRTIPYNYYAIFTLVMILFIIITNTEFGPMKEHEKNAVEKNDLYTTESRPYGDDEHEIVTGKGTVADLIVPVVVLIASCIIAMVYTGGFFDGETFIDAFANCDASQGLVLGGFVTLIFTFAFYLVRNILTFEEFTSCIPEGFKSMVAPILILTLAWTLSGMTGLLGSKEYIAAIVESTPTAFTLFLPAIIFVVSLFLAFATGTSWGTFAIIVPIVFATFTSGEMMVISIAACLSGAVCGDHCSPISDTTIMASAGAHCDHVNHVGTQLPYAMTAAIIAFVWYIFAGVLDSVLGASAGVMTSVLLLGAGVVVELIILSVMRKITNKI